MRRLATYLINEWAARVSIPAPWELGQTMHPRSLLSRLPGQWTRHFDRRPQKFSRI